MPPNLYWILHDGKTICAISPKALELFHCDLVDIIGRDIFEIIPNADMRGLAKLRMSHIIERGNLGVQELPLQRPDGSTFWAKVQTKKIGLDTLVSFLEYIGEHNPNYRGT